MKLKQQLENTIQLGLLVLVALMPFHAFLSVWLGHLFGHEAIIQAWKEVLLLALAVATGALCLLDPARLRRLRQPWVMLAGGFVLVAVAVTLATRPPLTGAAFGAKTDLEFLLAAVTAVLVATPQLIRRLTAIILASAAVVVAIGLAQAFLLPPDFFRVFGYGPDTVLPYEHIIPGVNALRFPSTLGGPNQLGTYLILPLCLSLAVAIRRRQWWWLGVTTAGLIVLAGTYSRSAWLGAAAALFVTLLVEVPERVKARAALGIGAVILIGLALLPLIARNPALRYVVLHSTAPQAAATTAPPSSDSEHAQSLATGVKTNRATPLGHGLGSAGPATFHAGTGLIIENYYLQIAYETGVLGGVLFVLLVIALVMRLSSFGLTPLLAVPTASAIVGISLVALVLPAWTDSTTALITWTAAGAVAGLKRVANV